MVFRNSYIFISFLWLSGLWLSCNSNHENEISAPTDNEPEASSGEADPESIYQFEGEWHNQDGDTVQLSMFQGKIPVMAMAFTNCAFACPRIVEDMKNIENQSHENKKKDLAFVFISFDSENDTPTRLREYAKEMDLSHRWVLLHGDEENVRELSMLLDVNYKKQRDGLYAHSNEIILLDKKGRIVTRTEGLGINPLPIVKKIEDL